MAQCRAIKCPFSKKRKNGVSGTFMEFANNCVRRYEQLKEEKQFFVDAKIACAINMSSDKTQAEISREFFSFKETHCMALQSHIIVSN